MLATRPYSAVLVRQTLSLKFSLWRSTPWSFDHVHDRMFSSRRNSSFLFIRHSLTRQVIIRLKILSTVCVLRGCWSCARYSVYCGRAFRTAFSMWHFSPARNTYRATRLLLSAAAHPHSSHRLSHGNHHDHRTALLNCSPSSRNHHHLISVDD